MLSGLIRCQVSGSLEFELMRVDAHKMNEDMLLRKLQAGVYKLELQGAGVSVVTSRGGIIAVSTKLEEFLEFKDFEIDDLDDLDLHD